MDTYKILVSGGSGSGKSAYAESRILKSGIRPRYYLATMQGGELESEKKIEAHRKRREGKGWITIEEPCDIIQAAGRITEPGGALLLEDLSNLLANVMFGGGADIDIMEGIRALEKKVSLLVIVTNSVFDDGIRYDADTEKYLRALADLNRKLAEQADEVVESVVGIPVQIVPKRTVLTGSAIQNGSLWHGKGI